MQYNPLNGVVSSTATVSLFTTDGVLGAKDTVDVADGSAVSGTLPGTLVFSNTNGVNDYNHAITFGHVVDFLVTTSNAGNTAGIGASTFSLGVFSDAQGLSPLLNTNGGAYAGTAVMINQYDNGNTSAVSLDASTTATPTPIPAAAWLLGSGLMGLAGVRRRKL